MHNGPACVPDRGTSWAVLGMLWLLVVVSALLTRPLLPVDETRYAAVAWEMWSRGDLLVPHLNGEPYSHKPPLYFWLIHAGWWLFGVSEWVLRAVSPLLAAGILLAVARLSRRLWPGDPGAARAAPWVLFGCVSFTAVCSWVQFDLLLTLCALLALNGVASASRGRGRGWLLTGIALGCGILAKGPVVLLHVLPAALFAPFWRGSAPTGSWWRWYAGLALSVLLAAGIALGWALPAAASGGEAYREALLWGQTADRMMRSFAHAHPLWWYLPWLPLLFAPWSLLPWLWPAVRRSRPLQDAGIRFCLAWLVGGFLLLSLVSGKQFKYLLPLLPAATLLLGRVLSRMEDMPVRQRPWLLAAVLLLLGALVMVLPVTFDQAAWFREVSPLWGGLLVILAVFLARLPPLRPLQYPQMLALLAAATVSVVQVGLFRAAAPAYDLHVASRFVASAQAEGHQVGAVTSYHGQFGFYGRLTRPIQQIQPGGALAWARSHPHGYLVITGRHLVLEPDVAAFTQPYRGGRLAIVDGKTLLQHPGLLP